MPKTESLVEAQYLAESVLKDIYFKSVKSYFRLNADIEDNWENQKILENIIEEMLEILT